MTEPVINHGVLVIDKLTRDALSALEKYSRPPHPDGLPLFGKDLLSKWGFSDGDAPEEIECYSEVWDKALEALVRERLLPLLPGVEIKLYFSHHNPIRATAETAHLISESEDVSVVVPWDDVVATVKRFMP
jgi:hypothetical protein